MVSRSADRAMTDEPLASAVSRALREKITQGIAVRENQMFLDSLVTAIEPGLRQVAPDVTVLDSRPGVRADAISVKVIRYVQQQAALLCEAKFGEDIAQGLLRGYDAMPFGVIFDSRDSVSRILDGHPPKVVG